MNELRTMHLFAGIGGGLLADIILGHRPVVAVEWEPYACQVLRERAAEGWFPDMRVWEGDVRMFDPSEYYGKVDCIHAGFPCQDISVAGKQAGVSEGTRSGLYREVLRIAGIVRPRYLFLENVAAILSNGLGTVLGDLAAMGYDSRWCCIRASDCGAPHHRDRWWCLSRHTDHDGSSSTEVSGGIAQGSNSDEAWEKQTCESKGSGDTKILANADSGGCWKDRERKRLGEVFNERTNKRVQTAESSSLLSDTMFKGLERQREIACGTGTEQQNTSDTCWWNTEPGLGRVANGVPNRVGQLKGYGNAQVPLQAAVAWKLLGGE